MKGFRNILLGFLLLVVVGYVQAATIHVPGDYSTIQAGINAASNGDTVLVANGTYTGPGNVNLNFNPDRALPVKNIIVKSANGPVNCIIDCQNVPGTSGFDFNWSNEGLDSVVDGFTIRGATNSAVRCDGSSPTISNNTITGNSSCGIYFAQTWMPTYPSSPRIVQNNISGNSGNGISCMGNPTFEPDESAEIINNTITGNSGYGIWCNERSHPIISNNTIAENSWTGIYCRLGAYPAISSNTIADNSIGIYCWQSSNPVITNNIIESNSSSGVACSASSPIIEGNIIRGNSDYGIGSVENSAPTITGNIIMGNSAGGILCHDNPKFGPPDSPEVTNNLIAGNSGSGIRCEFNEPIITNNTITGNWAGKGGGLYCVHLSSPTIINSIFWGNSPQEIYLELYDPVYSNGPSTVTISYSDIQGGEVDAGGPYNVNEGDSVMVSASGADAIVINDGVVNWLDGNIDEDPLFIDATNDDYHLSDSSPCIGAGTSVGAPTIDIEGNTRGIPPDMGAYENPRNEPLPMVTPLVADDTDPVTFEWDLDNDGIFETLGQHVMFSAVELDGPCSRTITVRVTDNGEPSGTAQTNVNVQNVAPTVGPITAPMDPVVVGKEIEVGASFSDPCMNDTHMATWAWGDGDSDTKPTGPGIVNDTHIYTIPGVYTVVLTVTDDDGGSGSSEFRYISVYGSSGGFVTGGGWIDSPQGAYAPDPTLAGKANFGFVSKYRKGATVPTGNTEFNLKTGNLNFHSDSYDWLLVNQDNTNAQYKGSGTINGDAAPNAEPYKFMIWAKDLDPDSDDTFRIKIWYEDTEEIVIYDNGFDQLIGGGNIKIHDNSSAAPAKPTEFALEQSYPNPFNPDTWVPYQLAEDVDVTIRIYDAAGHLVRTLNLGQKAAGFYMTREKAAHWDGKSESGEQVASGVYFYTIQAGDFTATKKMVVAK